MNCNKYLGFILLAVLTITFHSRVYAETAQPLYVSTTADNLAKSNWLFRELDENNNRYIDQYLLITECDLYNQYYTNDIEWSKIRDATRSYIAVNRKNFPNRFEFIQPIYLGRYDVASKSFDVAENSRIMGVGIMQVSGNYATDFTCLKTSEYDPKVFPLNAVLNLSRPLNYTSVKTSEENAQEYLKYIADNGIVNEFGRPAYVRYRFKVEQSLNPVALENRVLFYNFFGALESMTVFGDKGLFIKLEDVKL